MSRFFPRFLSVVAVITVPSLVLTSPAMVSGREVSAQPTSHLRGDTPPPKEAYREQTSPENVLENLALSYRRRETGRYGETLADDFKFIIDEDTRQGQGLPAFWDRLEDLGQTNGLFISSDITDIRVALTYGNPQVVNEIGRENWLRIDVLDTFLEVDQAPRPGETEGTTFRVDGQLQRFFFRKGRNPADTDTTTSETAGLYFLVEWQDFGFGAGRPAVELRPASPQIESTTWSSIKVINDFTAVASVHLQAVQFSDGVRLLWSAQADRGHVGFRVSRVDLTLEADTSRQALALHGGLLAASAREFVDRTAATDRRYAYWLEAVDRSGLVQRFGPAQISVVRPTLWVGVPSPNPMATSVVLPVRLDDDSGSVFVVDLSGRRIRDLPPPSIGHGVIIWDGKSNGGSDASPGIYFIYVDHRSETIARRIVKVR